jgi:hypothetical protein
MKRFALFLLVSVLFVLTLSITVAQDTYTVSTRTARVRAEPNTTSTIITTLRYNATLDVVGAVEGAKVSGSTLWYEVNVNGTAGYIHSSLVKVSGASGSGTNSGGTTSSDTSQAIEPAPMSVVPPSTGVSCGGATTCKQMASCEQAYACLAAGRSSLDRDKDGVPCESICPGG